MADLKDVAGALGADVKALDVEAAPKPSLFHRLIAGAGAALVGVVEAGARGMILATVPAPYQKYALDFEKMGEEWLAAKMAGTSHGLSHKTVADLHDGLAVATDYALSTFVAPKLGASGTAIVGKLAHAAEDAAAAAIPQDGPKL